MEAQTHFAEQFLERFRRLGSMTNQEIRAVLEKQGVPVDASTNRLWLMTEVFFIEGWHRHKTSIWLAVRRSCEIFGDYNDPERSFRRNHPGPLWKEDQS